MIRPSVIEEAAYNGYWFNSQAKELNEWADNEPNRIKARKLKQIALEMEMRLRRYWDVPKKVELPDMEWRYRQNKKPSKGGSGVPSHPVFIRRVGKAPEIEVIERSG